MRVIFLATLSFFLIARSALADTTVSLIDPATADEDWRFNNGAEFPGATGSLNVRDDAALELIGDFTGGGGYVQAGRRLPDLEIRELSLRVKTPGTEKFTLRLGDSSGQTHQIVLKCDPGGDWQQITLPLESFFAQRGQSDALTEIARYESWGGAGDGRWHGPARGIYFLLAKSETPPVQTLALRDITITSPPIAVPGAEIEKTRALSEVIDGEHEWKFTEGPEYPGASGSLTVEGNALRLTADFTGGGGYVGAIRTVDDPPKDELKTLRFSVRSTAAKSITLKLVDSTEQTHQRRNFPIPADGEWHTIEVDPQTHAGGEHWDGANDGKWHGGLQKMAISLTKTSSNDLTTSIEFRDVSAVVQVPAFAQPAAFAIDFEEPLDSSWALSEGVTNRDGRLELSRTLNEINRPCSAVSPTFPVSHGKWKIDVATSSDLSSPDNSYHGKIILELMDATGQPIDRIAIVEQFGEHDWETKTQLLELPQAAVSARFHAQLNKTYGTFRIDSMSAAYLSAAPERDDRISRLLFSTAQLGNLLFPEDPRTVEVSVVAKKPLREDQRTIAWRVHDYWGAEQSALGTVSLGTAERRDRELQYSATIDLSDIPLNRGRYYEIHAEIPVGEGTFENHTSFAILPEAITREYAPEEIPFTSRNWDNRITEYIRLTDRLGIRTCGIWGGWSSEPPYTPVAPNLDLCAELGMGWLTNTPIAKIERGDTDYDETALREGVRNLIETYGHVRPMTINLGNEPHGTGEQVTQNVAAYRAVYEEVKKVDPTIRVVATSVEPNEEYFRKGYADWCDAYDFHIYESSEKVRNSMVKYRELAKKYDREKPIWSTELGLNSQGQPRHRVAAEVFKKVASFFAEGGESVSWFGLLYPDPDGKSHGSSGDSHNVFDCRYNRYAPRLDAIAYYHAVNAVAIKKFVTERKYPDGTHAFLFKDSEDRALQVLWNESETVDVFLPLPDANDVELIRVDGSHLELNASNEGVTLTIGDDPILLLYKDILNELPASLGSPEGTMHLSELKLEVRTELEPELIAPRFWTVEQNERLYTLLPPEPSAVRELDLTVRLRDSKDQTRGVLFRRSPIP